MKTYIIALSLILIGISGIAQVSDTLTDARDGKVYKTIKIGSQTWMAENLKYEPQAGNFWKHPNSKETVGCYYDFVTAKTVAPAGWHLPSKEEWLTLISFLGGDKDGILSKLSQAGFRTDFYGYYMPVGKIFSKFGDEGFFWSTTEDDSEKAWCFQMYWDDVIEADFATFSTLSKQYGTNIRCIKD